MKNLFIVCSIITSLYSCGIKNKTLDVWLTNSDKMDLLYHDLLYEKVFDLSSHCKFITLQHKYSNIPDSIQTTYLELMNTVSYSDTYNYYKQLRKLQLYCSSYPASVRFNIVQRITKCNTYTEEYKAHRVNKIHDKYRNVHRLVKLKEKNSKKN